MELPKLTTTHYVVIGGVALAALYLLVLNKPASAATKAAALPPPAAPVTVVPGQARAEVPSGLPSGTAMPVPQSQPSAPGVQATIAGVYLTGPDGSVQNGVPLGTWYRPDNDTWYSTILIQYTDGTFGNQFIPVVHGQVANGAAPTHPNAAAITYVIDTFKAGAIGLPKPS